MHYIEKLYVRDYQAIRELEIALTPLHAFIGPNDSGKSCVLRAVGTAATLAGGSFRYRGEKAFQPFDPGLGDGPQAPFIGIKATAEARWYALLGQGPAVVDGLGDDPNEMKKRLPGRGALSARPLDRLRPYSGGPYWKTNPTPAFEQLFSKPVRLVHASPDRLRKPAEIIPSDSPVDLVDPYGGGLPAIYDAILNRGDEAFLEISKEVRRYFPTIKALRLEVVSKGTKALEVDLVTGERVSARFLSEGLLYYLLFAALRYLEPASLILVEEPENGLHPSRIRDVVNILREVSRTTQVLIATHSPLVVNELEPEQVTVVTRDPEAGTRATRLTETYNFEERAKVYAPGELWLSYANGYDEADLIGPKTS